MTLDDRPMRAFYGWRIVAACLVFATVSWSLGVFGMGVYVYALTQHAGFSLSAVSTAVTTAYVVSALLTLSIGSLTARHGARPVVLTGVVTMATGLILLAHSDRVWQLYVNFFLIGAGMSCLSTTMIGTTLAPWFEREQGRAMSSAMLGASVGGILGTPLLMAGIAAWGFAPTALIAALVAVVIVAPIAILVLIRRPQDIGQFPDGAPDTSSGGAGAVAAWTRRDAVRTRQFQTQIVAFGLGLMVQIGFLSHHVKIALPVLGPSGAAMAVSAAAIAAFAGRLLLARHIDRIEPRLAACAVLAFGAVCLFGFTLWPTPAAIMGLSIAYGITVGNVTTLAPIIIRREFGAAAFGTVFGLAAMCNQLCLAIGPAVFGLLREWSGSYAAVLQISAGLDLLAAAVILWGGRRPLTEPPR